MGKTARPRHQRPGLPATGPVDVDDRRLRLPRLRLFGPVAEAARTRCEEVEGTSLDEVLATARLRYGEEFAAHARCCRVWVNGEVPPPGLQLGPADEVALLPPVSGG
ncbi:MAG: MoaD/ThiS family protein [Acidimicrobiales bacterium]